MIEQKNKTEKRGQTGQSNATVGITLALFLQFCCLLTDPVIEFITRGARANLQESATFVALPIAIMLLSIPRLMLMAGAGWFVGSSRVTQSAPWRVARTMIALWVGLELLWQSFPPYSSSVWVTIGEISLSVILPAAVCMVMILLSQRFCEMNMKVTCDPAESQKSNSDSGITVICLLYGIAAALNIWAFPSGTFVGRALFASMACGFAVVTWLLWARKSKSWLIAILVWLSWVVSLVVVSGRLLSSAYLIQMITIRGGVFPNFTFVLSIMARAAQLAWPLIAIYLVWRRGKFSTSKRDNYVRYLSALIVFGLTAIAVFCAILLNLDAPIRSYPKLKMESKMPEAHRNGDDVFQEVIAREDCDQDNIEGGMSPKKVWGKMGRAKKKWLSRAETMVQQNSECIKQIAHVLDQPPFRFTSPPERKSRRLLRKMAYLLALESEVDLAAGRSEKALVGARQVLSLGQRWGRAGASVEYATGIEIMRAGLRQFRRIAADSGAGKRTLKMALESLPEESSVVADRQRAVRKDFHRRRRIVSVIQDSTMDNVTVNIATGTVSERKTIGPRISGPFVMTEYPMLKRGITVNGLGEYHIQLLKAAEQEPHRSSCPMFYKHFSLLDRLRNPFGCWLLRNIIPFDRVLFHDYWLFITSMRITKIYLAVRLYKLRRGRFPDELTELVPNILEELPHDPFTDQILGYDRKEKSLLLYSVGPDGKRASTDSDDVVTKWRVP